MGENLTRKIRTFASFPQDVTCPMCGTNDDREAVLLFIDGTADGNIEEAQPFHLDCAVATRYAKELGLIYGGVP